MCRIQCRTRADAIALKLIFRVMLPTLLLVLVCPLAQAAESDALRPPGVVIDYSPAASGKYIGSPALAVLPNGVYLASHDEFGPKSTYKTRARTKVFQSTDRGQTWTHRSDVDGIFWASLFARGDAVYLLGTDKQYGDVVIFRSKDGGKTWTTPTDARSGLLLTGGKYPGGGYHCAPVPLVEHNGRIWRAMEDAMGPKGWGHCFRAFMMSAPIDSDWLLADSWTCSNRLERNPLWLGERFGGWLEGNAVVTPEGDMVDILRVDERESGGLAAVIRISDDGRWAAFDSGSGFIEFPGGSKKFTIRYDPVSKHYWSLSNWMFERHEGINPPSTRNTVALIRSADLNEWSVRSIVLHHPEVEKHGFQYLDWRFDGDDLIAVSRTAYDDTEGGAHNFHDANYLTFHRIEGFRDLNTGERLIE